MALARPKYTCVLPRKVSPLELNPEHHLRRPVGGHKPGRCGMVVPNGVLFGDGVWRVARVVAITNMSPCLRTTIPEALALQSRRVRASRRLPRPIHSPSGASRGSRRGLSSLLAGSGPIPVQSGNTRSVDVRSGVDGIQTPMTENASTAVPPSETVPAGHLAPWQVGNMPAPPHAGWRLWVGLLGPGVVLAGTSIGSGEWLFGPAVSGAVWRHAHVAGNDQHRLSSVLQSNDDALCDLLR